MRNVDFDQILFNADGKVTGFKSGDKEARAPLIICDPTYCPQDRLKHTGKVVRAICFLDHPIPHTGDATSAQIIIPSKQLQRNNDIFISMVSSIQSVCVEGYYIATVSTSVETDSPEEEIQPALKLLGEILEMFISVTDTYEPL